MCLFSSDIKITSVLLTSFSLSLIFYDYMLCVKNFKMGSEREEGELTDEELEDVSDSSISLHSLIFHDKIDRESLRELSLTSVSEDSSEDLSGIDVQDGKSALHKLSSLRDRYYKRKRYDDNYTQKRVKYSKNKYGELKTNTRPVNSTSSSSDSEEYLSNKRIFKQLRDAVRISSTKKNPNCSLRTRIKRMIEPDSPDTKKSDDEDLNNLRNQALKSKSSDLNIVQNEECLEKSSVITDEDLTNLRLIALQSAVLKKHENRRKRKQALIEKEQIDLNQTSDKTDNVINDIVNQSDSNHVEITNKNKDCEIVNSIVPDNILINKNPVEVLKNEDIEQVSQKSPTEEDEDILRAMLLASISKKISTKMNSKQHKEDRRIKISNKTPNIKKPQLSVTTKPKTPVKRLVINVNSDTESETDNKTLKERQIDSKKLPSTGFEQDLSKFLKEARKKSEIQQQSDISKHLPRSQQIEYRHLKRKLQQLSKQNSLQKYKKSNIIETKYIKRNILTENKISSAKKQLNNKLNRLQIKGKYETLGPLMAKITKVREARDVAENDVKRLINELKEAREKLTSTHQTYTVLIKQLQQAKAELDERSNVLPSSENKIVEKVVKKVSNVYTSTPLKENRSQNLCEISNICDETVKITEDFFNQKEDIISTTIISNKDIITKEKTELPQEIDNVEQNVIDMECVEGNVASSFDKIVDKETSDNVMKYNSPLEHIQLSSEKYEGNPLSVLCPYDLLGVCRDPDCSYQH